MANTNVLIKEIPSSILQQRYVSEQPVDRHLIEITDKQKSVFINAGIDSTCAKKRAAIIHKFNNGIITVVNAVSLPSISVAEQLELLSLNHSKEMRSNEEVSKSNCASDVRNSKCCAHCGK
ncbi:unnamed protein product [Adineta steineri]|uniref:Uncharacterized protein n=1 Tax=Adineta steineri TaxID=433720 RepID=A0A814RWV2_9BILA|nr:unnamed protein product [Adineta steineri]CAF3594428.1 unnamed protein product [Adineta steineri]